MSPGALLHRLRRDERALALIEFAISLPVLLILGLTGIEVANYAIANLRVSQIAMSTADNASRVRDSIDEYDINELFTGAKLMGQGIKFADHARIILSSLEPNTAGTAQWIRWQRCYGLKNVASSYGVPKTSGSVTITDGTEAFKTDGVTASSNPSNQAKSVPTDGTTTTPTTGMGPTGNQVASMSGTAVMFVEVWYDYQPIVANGVLGTQTLHYTSAFNVRQRTNQVLQPDGLASGSWSTCNRYYS